MLWQRCFPVNFRKFLRRSFLTEHIWWLFMHLYLLMHLYQHICLCSIYLSIYMCMCLSWVICKFVNFSKSRLIHNILLFLNVCKQTFHISHVRISQEVCTVPLYHIVSLYHSVQKETVAVVSYIGWSSWI